jgi:hypothetical protein
MSTWATEGSCQVVEPLENTKKVKDGAIAMLPKSRLFYFAENKTLAVVQ